MSITWSDQPSNAARLPHLPLRRVPPGAAYGGIITTTRTFWTWTHWYTGRTLPHVNDECPACAAKCPKREEGYVGLLFTEQRAHFICALTPQAWDGIEATAPDTKNLRGLRLILQRVSKRANSKLTARCELIELAQLHLPPEPNIGEHMLRIWGLDDSPAARENPGYADRVRDMIRGNGSHQRA